MSSEPKKHAPAYVPFETFQSFIHALHEAALPAVIDKSLMPTLSGGTQSHLMAALRFLNLIGEKGQTTERLRELVNAAGDKEAWGTVLSGIITEAYKPIVGSLDIATTSAKQLENAFKDNTSFDGTMLERCIRFYLKSLKDAKVQVSPHLGRKKRTTATPKRNTDKPKAPTLDIPSKPEAKPEREDAPPQGTIRFPVYFKGKPNGSIVVPESLTSEEVNVIELMIPVIKAYAAQNASVD